MRVVLTGGGSAGHILPFEPIVDELRVLHREQAKDLPAWLDRRKIKFYFLGVVDSESREFFENRGIKVINIPAAKLRRYPSGRTLSDMVLRMPIGLVKSLWHMWRLMPDVVISKGGYGSVPVSLAAVFYRIPYVLHESDAVVGLATRLTSIGAAVITVGFAESRHAMPRSKRKTVVTGTPVRTNFVRESVAEAKDAYGFAADELVLLVLGGSQGAKQLNEILLQVLPSFLEDMGVVHITGKKHIKHIRKRVSKLDLLNKPHAYRPYGFVNERISTAMQAADVVVSRAGATVLAELTRLRKPCILVPLDEAAQNHQYHNARVYEVAEAARVIGTENLGRALFEQNIRDLMDNEALRITLAHNIARLDHPRAAFEIAELAFKLAQGLVPQQPTESV